MAPGFNTTLGFILYMARRFDEAERQLRATLEIDTGYPLALVALSETLGQPRPLGRGGVPPPRPTRRSDREPRLPRSAPRAGRRTRGGAVHLAEMIELRSTFHSSQLYAALIHAHLGELDQGVDLPRARSQTALRAWFGSACGRSLIRCASTRASGKFSSGCACRTSDAAL